MRSPTGLLALALAALLWQGCGDGSGGPDEAGITLPDGAGPCGPGTCPGCCQAGTCVAGTDKSACGAGGFPCVACQANQQCTSGQCVTYSDKCNPQNCNGCCKGDTCVAGTDKSACGSGGTHCVTCAASQQCVNNACSCGAGCSGCCDATGTCRSGFDDKACGLGGAPCKDCTPAGSCVNGTCSSGGSCGPSSCNGCCQGTTCKKGDEVTACGQGGQPCQKCVSGETCSPVGTCVNSSKCDPSTCTGCCKGSQCLSGQSASACGSGGAPCTSCSSNQLCKSGGCVLDPTSKWGIVIGEASIDTSKKWDTLVYTAPDPYVSISVGSNTHKTTTKSDTYTPKWDEYTFTTSASAITTWGMNVSIYDDDSWPSSDQLMGACKISVTEKVLSSGAGMVNSCGSSGHIKKLTFTFKSY